MYTPVTWVSDVWLYKTFVIKDFFASYMMTDLLLTSILMSLFSFPYFFADIAVVALAALVFFIYVDR